MRHTIDRSSSTIRIAASSYGSATMQSPRGRSRDLPKGPSIVNARCALRNSAPAEDLEIASHRKEATGACARPARLRRRAGGVEDLTVRSRNDSKRAAADIVLTDTAP